MLEEEEKVYDIHQFEAEFKIGDPIIFHYVGDGGKRKYIFGIIKGFLDLSTKGYRSGGIEFEYYRVGEENLSDLRGGDIDVEHVMSPRLVKDSELLLEI